MLSGATAPERPHVRGELYVDDPCFAIRGTRPQRDRWIALIVVIWRILGFPVAFSKARRGFSVCWIGAALRLSRPEVVVSIPEAKREELQALVDAALRVNVISIKKLRKLAGLACHFANLVYVWRPFLAELWGAIQAFDADQSSRAPDNCIWVKQIAPALTWIAAFLSRAAGTVSLTSRVDAFANKEASRSASWAMRACGALAHTCSWMAASCRGTLAH